MKRIATISVLIMLAAVLAGVAIAEQKVVVKIYMPSTVQINTPGQYITLGDICVVRCSDDSLRDKVAAVEMGRSPWSQEQLPVDRVTVISRLAAIGISADQLEITGADRMTVSREEIVVQQENIQKIADEFLKQKMPATDESRLEVVRKPQDIAIPAGKDVTYTTRLAENPPPGHVKVEVVAQADGQKLGSSEVLFKQVRAANRVVAAKDIPIGEVVTINNCRIEKIPPGQPIPAVEYSNPFGLVTTQAIKSGEVITPKMVAPPKPPLVLQRNQLVVMKVDRGNFAISCMGVAIQDGYAGEIIKVRNVDSGRIVSATVMPDGHVEPIYEDSSSTTEQSAPALTPEQLAAITAELNRQSAAQSVQAGQSGVTSSSSSASSSSAVGQQQSSTKPLSTDPNLLLERMD